MERAKDYACDQSSAHFTSCCGEKPIGGVGTQRYLLQQAKGQVSKEMLRDEQGADRAMQRAKKNAHGGEYKDAGHEDHGGPLRGGP